MTDDLKRGLEQIARTPRDRPQIDIAEPAARGRRVLRVRRAWAVAGSAAAVGLVATLVAAGLPHRDAAPPAPPVSQPDTGAHPNPLVQRAVFGRLPQGYTPRSVIEDFQNGRHTFETMAAPGSVRQGTVDLTDFGAGPEPILGYLSGGIPIKPASAPRVNGRPAHWVTKPGSGYGGRLRWEYGPHRWAEISTHGSADNTRAIYQIAESITFGTAKPTAFPFTVAGFPAGLKVCRSMAGPGLGDASDDSVNVAFAAGAYGPNNSLEISVTRMGIVAKRIQWGYEPGRRITVDGHRALDRQTRSGGVARHTLIVLGVHGFDVTVAASGPTLQRLEATGGVAGLYRRMTVLGTNSAKWTTAPLA